MKCTLNIAAHDWPASGNINHVSNCSRAHLPNAKANAVRGQRQILIHVVARAFRFHRPWAASA